MITTTAYTIRTINSGAVTATVSVIYADGIDSDTAPSWRDDADVEAHLADELGGEWTPAGEWDAGDHPTRLEMVATWQRVEAAE
jgi:hypothetical protein